MNPPMQNNIAQLPDQLCTLQSIHVPDIMFAASKLAQFNSNPSMQYLRAAKHLLRYIQGTKDPCNTAPIDYPIGFCDASFAADPEDTFGCIFFLAHGPISWQSNKQSTVALSTMEAGYIALSEAGKETKFLRHLLTITNPVIGPTIINTDSQAALEHVKNNIRHARTNHIYTHHHFIRNVYTSSEIDLVHVSSDAQKADILTKPLGRLKHDHALHLLKLEHLSVD